MADEVRVYRKGGLFSNLVKTVLFLAVIPLLNAVIEALLPGLAGGRRGDAAIAALLRFCQLLTPVFFVSLVVNIWLSFFLKLPRLELTSHSIKYLTFQYSLEALWEDIERIEMFTRIDEYPAGRFTFERKQLRVDIGRGLVASKYSFQFTKWGRLIQNYSYPTYQGIPIERLFTSNIYLGDLRNDMKQYIPHVFENNPYLV